VTRKIEIVVDGFRYVRHTDVTGGPPCELHRRERGGRYTGDKEAYAWHEAKEPGLGNTFLERLNETIARIAQNPVQYALVVADVRRA
jgi:hypothetical protein